MEKAPNLASNPSEIKEGISDYEDRDKNNQESPETLAVERGEQFEKGLLENIDANLDAINKYLKIQKEVVNKFNELNAMSENGGGHTRFSRPLKIRKGLEIEVPLSTQPPIINGSPLIWQSKYEDGKIKSVWRTIKNSRMEENALDYNSLDVKSQEYIKKIDEMVENRDVYIYSQANALDSINKLVEKYYLPILEGKIDAPDFWSCHYGPVPNSSDDAYEEDRDNIDEAMKLSKEFIEEICRKLGYIE